MPAANQPPQVPDVDETRRRVAASMLRMEAVLAARPVQMMQRVGGEVELVVVTPHGRQAWHVAALGKVIRVAPSPAPSGAPALRIGVEMRALRRLVEGTLDVKRAFAERLLAVEGSAVALERFVACFGGAQSALGLRTGGASR